MDCHAQAHSVARSCRSCSTGCAGMCRPFARSTSASHEGRSAVCGSRYDSERTRLRTDASRGLSVKRSSVGLSMRERTRARKAVWEQMSALFGSRRFGFRQKKREAQNSWLLEHCTFIRHEVRDELAQLGHAVVRRTNTMPHDVLQPGEKVRMAGGVVVAFCRVPEGEREGCELGRAGGARRGLSLIHI